jgi:class 3 adenylate cyclase
VVVGPLVHDPQRPYTAVGDTLALATRLQQQVAPDTVLVSAATYALVQAEVQAETWTAGPSTASSLPASAQIFALLMTFWLPQAEATLAQVE